MLINDYFLEVPIPSIRIYNIFIDVLGELYYTILNIYFSVII